MLETPRFRLRPAAVLLVLLLGASSAHAEKDIAPWYRGKYGRNRVIHLSVTLGLGVAYLAQATFLQSPFLSEKCRWCEPPGFDKAARNAVVWHDVKRANFLSTMDAYVLSPLVGVTLLAISDQDASASRLIDDILPVAETVAISQLLLSVVKFATARARPYVYYNDTRVDRSNEDFLSFPSGHSALGFAVTAGAGMVCHWRHYWTEPYVWGSGIALSLSTEYLRMAADRHWMSDVITGGLVGLASGLLVPRLMRHDIKIAPVPGGAAVIGQF